MKEKNQNNNIIRSSSAEYLTFIAATGDGGVNAIYQDENIWLTQKMMGELYQVETHTINYHLKKILQDSELEEEAVIRKFRITHTGLSVSLRPAPYSFPIHLSLIKLRMSDKSILNR